MTDEPTENGRRPNGTFAPGNPGGPGNRSGRVNIARVVRREAERIGVDIDELLLEAMLAMLWRAACGDVECAKVAFAQLGELEQKGPLVGINIGDRVPELPPATASPRQPVTLAEHLDKLTELARERGLHKLGEDLKPAEVVVEIAESRARAELLS